jgi:hypothetical protein
LARQSVHGAGMKENASHRRHAMQMACTLPEGKEDVLMVLQVLKRLVELPGFWGDDEPEKPVVQS